MLDELNLLRNRRSLAYRFNDQNELAEVHLEMKNFWLRNGWTEQEAEQEHLKHIEECSKPYQSPVGLLAITHSVYNRKSGNAQIQKAMDIIAKGSKKIDTITKVIGIVGKVLESTAKAVAAVL